MSLREVEDTSRPLQVVAGVLFVEGRLLVGQRPAGGRHSLKWEFPGGKIEDGETPEQCLKRELNEEFEIDVEVSKYLGTSVHEYDFGIIELMAYGTRVVRGEFKLNDHAEIAWVSKDEIGEYDYAPADLPFVEMIRRGEIEL